jgi:hypothetical protein
MAFIDINDTESPLAKEQELQNAQSAIVGEVPLIAESPDVIVDLPRGYFNGSKWETEVELRELTGADEENLARFKESADFFNGVIVYGTTRIGSNDLRDMSFADRQSFLAGLLIGEREQLFLHIARVTYGNEKEIAHSCPACGVESETTLLISEDIKCKELENPSQLTYTMVTNKGDVLTYRLATGSDQMAVMAKKGASTAEQNTLMISECVTQINSKPVIDPMATARNLSMGDRQKLISNLVDNQPSPQLNITIECVGCGFEMILPLSWGDIFRP